MPGPFLRHRRLRGPLDGLAAVLAGRLGMGLLTGLFGMGVLERAGLLLGVGGLRSSRAVAVRAGALVQRLPLHGFARALVAVATTAPASASAPPPAASTVLALLFALRGRGLLAEPGRLALVMLIRIGRLFGCFAARFTGVDELGPLAASIFAPLALRVPVIGPLVTPSAASPAARTAVTLAFSPLGRRPGLGLRRLLLGLLTLEAPFHVDDRAALGCLLRCGLHGRPLDGEVGALHAVAGLHRDGDAVPTLHVGDEGALVVEDVKGHVGRRHGGERVALIAQELILQRPQHGQRHRLDRADDARALAVRALSGGSLEHACAQALARHLEKAEMADAPHLDARAVVAQRVLETPLHLAVVAPLLHVDEVDDDQASEVPELQL